MRCKFGELFLNEDLFVLPIDTLAHVREHIYKMETQLYVVHSLFKANTDPSIYLMNETQFEKNCVVYLKAHL